MHPHLELLNASEKLGEVAGDVLEGVGSCQAVQLWRSELEANASELARGKEQARAQGSAFDVYLLELATRYTHSNGRTIYNPRRQLIYRSARHCYSQASSLRTRSTNRRPRHSSFQDSFVHSSPWCSKGVAFTSS